MTRLRFNLEDHQQASAIVVNSLDSLAQLIATLDRKQSAHYQEATLVIKQLDYARMALLNVSTTLEVDLYEGFTETQCRGLYRHGQTQTK